MRGPSKITNEMQNGRMLPFCFTSRLRSIVVGVWLIVIFAIVIPYSTDAQILQDLFKSANSGPPPQESQINVPGKTVRIKVGEIRTATWVGKPIWNVEGEIKFGPLHFAINGTQVVLDVTNVECLGLDDALEKSTNSDISYDKENDGSPESKNWPAIIEFTLPNDQRLFGQTVTANLQMQVAYLGLQNRPYQAPIVSPMDATMSNLVSFKIASAEDAKKYSAIDNSDTFQQFKFYIGLAFILVLFVVAGNIAFGRRR